MALYTILAVDEEFNIGYEGRLPWPKDRADMKWFRENTSNQAVLMGRTTSETLPFPLPNRLNIILSSQNLGYEYTIKDIESIPALVQVLEKEDKDLYLIGGKSLYTKELMQMSEQVLLTQVNGVFEADTKLEEDVVEYLKYLMEDGGELKEETPSCKMWVLNPTKKIEEVV